jgi:hypothetical protein
VRSFTEHHAMKSIGEWTYSSTHSLTSAPDGREWSTSRPDHFTPREEAPVTHRIGGSMGPRAVLDAVVKRKIPSPSWESNPITQIVQKVSTLNHIGLPTILTEMLCDFSQPLQMNNTKTVPSLSCDNVLLYYSLLTIHDYLNRYI